MAFVAACGGGSDDKTSDAPTAVPTVAAAASPTEAPTATQAAATVEPTMEHATMSEYPVEQATSATSAATVTAPTTTAAPDSKQVEVQILDFKFEPAVLEVEAGTTVTFINKGVDHTATAKDDPSIFDSGILHTGDSFSVTFDTPGMIDYWCLLHPNMLGMIMVR
ncbi:MAG: cupredoxin domain-containing protein [Thermomicrobiales bacterium]|nr:cupredoxin domain-containing protein [Thermomicrobiales bacterium]